MKIRTSFKMIPKTGFYQSKPWAIVLVVFIFLGLSILPVAAFGPLMDPIAQPETVGPITTLADDQFAPVDAYANQMDEYLVVWEEALRDFDYDIYAIRVDSEGSPISPEILIGTSGKMDTHPGVAYSPVMKEYLVVWENEYSTTDHDIFARRIDAITGALVGLEIHVAYASYNYDEKPVVTYNPGTHEYLVVYERRMGSDEFPQQDLVGQRLYENGTLMGGEILIANGYLDEQAPAVACDGMDYLVVWQGDIAIPEETNLYSQRIGGGGSLIGGQIAITTWDGDQLIPRITYNSDDGHYFVVWEDHHFTPWGIYGYRLDQTGFWVGSQVSIAAGGGKNRTDPDVAYLHDARSYQVVWQFEYSASDHDIYTRRVAYDGSQPETETSISTQGTEEEHPAMASDIGNRMLVVWEDWRNPGTTGWDIYGSLEIGNVPMLSGAVYEGDVGVTTTPLANVTMQLGCSSDLGDFGNLIGQTVTNAWGDYELPAYILCEYYNIQETDPINYFSIGAQSMGGNYYSSNWVYYTHPLAGKELSGNNFWDKIKPPVDITPPAHWANFSPQGWNNTQTVDVAVRVEDTDSGLAVGSAFYSYSRDGGASWQDWAPAQCTGSDSTTQPETISAAVSFGQDSNPSGQILIRFLITDMAGNVGQSPDYPVKIDTIAPINPTALDCPTHKQSLWTSNNLVSCTWAGATDANSGIAGYSIEWNIDPESIPNPYLEITDEQATSSPLSDGTWYFHVRSIDQAGNAADGAVHYGTILIDTTAPTVWFTEPAPGPVDLSPISIVWGGWDTHVGIWSYDIQYMVSGGSWTDWRMSTDYTSASYPGPRGQTVSFRVRARDYLAHLSEWTSPLTIYFGVPVTVVVQNESGTALNGADVYLNDTHQGATYGNGTLTLYDVLLGDHLSARYLIDQHTANKDHHYWIYGPISWSYRAYITSVNFDNVGNPEMLIVNDSDVYQVLVVRRDNPLIGFYVLASVEWDADDQYLNQLSTYFRDASAYLLDVTDGQMYFEVVDIWDEKAYWADADYHIQVSNFINPKAHVAGMWQSDPYHLFFGRYVGGPALIHEWGHYGLDLWDEYRNANDGSEGAGCTIDVKTTPLAEAASMMDHEGSTTEMCSGLTLHPHNTNTQQQAYRGGPCWDTVYDRYRDKQNPARWILERPDDRGSIMPGPTGIPVGGWYKTRIIGLGSDACAPFTITSTYPDGSPALDFDVWIKEPHALWEGRTRPNTDPKITPPTAGQIEILGAFHGDTIEVTKSCGWFCSYSGTMTAYCPTNLANVSLPSASTQAEPIILQPDPFAMEISAQITEDRHTLGITVLSSIVLPTPPNAEVWQDGGQVMTTTLTYDGSKYTGYVGLVPELGLKGNVFVIASDAEGHTVTAMTAFQAEQIAADSLTWLKSSDGKMEVFLQPGSLPGTPVVSIAQASAPALEQDELVVVGGAYQISVSSGVDILSQPAMVSINFSLEDLGLISIKNLGLYRWNAQMLRWVSLNSQVSTDVTFVSAQVSQLGIFAILGKLNYQYNLPLVIR